jgi:hypothetical protein
MFGSDIAGFKVSTTYFDGMASLACVTPFRAVVNTGYQSPHCSRIKAADCRWVVMAADLSV